MIIDDCMQANGRCNRDPVLDRRCDVLRTHHALGFSSDAIRIVSLGLVPAASIFQLLESILRNQSGHILKLLAPVLHELAPTTLVIPRCWVDSILRAASFTLEQAADGGDVSSELAAATHATNTAALLIASHTTGQHIRQLLSASKVLPRFYSAVREAAAIESCSEDAAMAMGAALKLTYHLLVPPAMKDGGDANTDATADISPPGWPQPMRGAHTLNPSFGSCNGERCLE